MEKIELKVEQLSGLVVDRHWSATFGVAGGTIGRGGQNKLILSDPDANVARVHAMVRLDSESAHIANLCERRSIYVSGLEVRSGDEVPLIPGVEVTIGPYSLRAIASGQAIASAAIATPARQAGLSLNPPQSLETKVASPLLGPSGLAATPNPWADIPQQAGGEKFSLPERLTVAKPAISPLVFVVPIVEPANVGTNDMSNTDNPFAILGRVPSNPSTLVAIRAPIEANGQSEPGALDGMPPCSPAAAHKPKSDMEIPAVSMQPAVPLENPFEKVGGPAPKPIEPEHRRLEIPEDFDPFVRDVKNESQARDPWGGGLQAQSLAEVAKLRNDELLQSLPATVRFEKGMDNASHTGLPKALDPQVELDPLALFGGGAGALLPAAAESPLLRGSELVQVFSMPRGEASVQERQETVIPRPTFCDAAHRPPNGSELDMFGTPRAIPEGVELLPLEGETPAPSNEATLHGEKPVLSIPALTRRHAEGPGSGLTQRDCSVSQQPVAERSGPTNALANPTELQVLVNAFLEGAGVEPKRSDPVLSTEFMRSFGEAFRVAVQGTIDLLAARSEIKREFRADVTIIAAGANNPLKFLPNAEGVIMQMVGQNFPGFMKPVPAMKDAYHDLQIHQLALMAGIRAAYSEALARFDPLELEKRHSVPASFLGKVSAVGKKAELWNAYKQSYDTLRRNAEDDLTAFSGQTFVDAYEAAAASARSHA